MNNPSWFEKFKERKIGQTLAVYLGSAWVFIEAINFLIDKYDLNAAILNVLILLVIFGLPAVLIYAWFQQKFTRKAIILQSINGIIALFIIGYSLVNPDRLDPTHLRLLKFKDNQKKLAESIQSLAVLPFDNYTGTDEFEYYVAGMHSGLIGDLGKISALRVISKTSSRLFKDVDMSIPEIATELGVDAVIEASVSCVEGDSVCIRIKLVSAFPEEQQLWVQDYYEEKSQILNLYNRVTKQISEEINIVLTPQEENLLADAKTVNTEAYDAYLKGHIYWEQLSENALNRALEYFNLAIEKDPEWAPLYAGLAKVWVGLVQMSHVSPDIAIPKIYENLNKALELDPNYAGSHFTNGIVAVWTEWDWEKGEKEFLTALKLNPNDVMSRIYYAHLLMILGRTDEALSQGQLALDLDPLNPLIQALFAVVLIDVGDYQSAIVHSEKALLADPGNFIAAFILELAATQNGDYEKAFEAGKQFLPLEVEVMAAIEKTFEEQGYFAAYKEIISSLEEAAQEGYWAPSDIAWRYSVVENPEKVLEWLEKGYEIHDPNMPYIYADYADYEPIKDDPRFIELLKKMKLPLGN